MSHKQPFRQSKGHETETLDMCRRAMNTTEGGSNCGRAEDYAKHNSKKGEAKQNVLLSRFQRLPKDNRAVNKVRGVFQSNSQSKQTTQRSLVEDTRAARGDEAHTANALCFTIARGLDDSDGHNDYLVNDSGTTTPHATRHRGEPHRLIPPTFNTKAPSLHGSILT